MSGDMEAMLMGGGESSTVAAAAAPIAAAADGPTIMKKAPPPASAAAAAASATTKDGTEKTTNEQSKAVIATDPKTGHIPSAAGSVIEAVDSISGATLLIRIQNIASTANLGVRLDLKKIALKCRNTECEFKRYVVYVVCLEA